MSRQRPEPKDIKCAECGKTQSIAEQIEGFCECCCFPIAQEWRERTTLAYRLAIAERGIARMRS